MPSTRSLNDPARIAECRRPIVRQVQCRSCGYEPPTGPTPVCCPKCRGGCWENFLRLGKLRPATNGSPGADGADASEARHDFDSDDAR